MLLLLLAILFSAGPHIQPSRLIDFREVDYGSIMSDNYVVSITEDPHGFIWIATRENILRFDGYSYTPVSKQISRQVFEGRNTVYDIRFSKGGDLLVCSNNGLFCVDIRNGTIQSFKDFSGCPVYAVLSFENDNWVLLDTSFGLALYDFVTNKAQFITKKDASLSFREKSAHAAVFDPEGNIWSCGDNLSKHIVNKDLLSGGSCPEINELVTETIDYFPLSRRNDIAIDRHGNMWLYNSQNVLVSTTARIEGGESPVVLNSEYTAIGFHGNDVIIGKRGHGNTLIHRDDEGKVLDTKNIQMSDRFDDLENTTNVYYDDGFNLWIGTRDGLFCMDADENNPFMTINNAMRGGPSLSHNSVNGLLLGRDGTLWVATSYGLNKVRFNADDSYDIVNYLPAKGSEDMSLLNKIECLTEVEQGLFWVGTKSDLIVFNAWTGTFHRNESTDAITGNSRFVRALTRDKNQNIWIGYQNGGVYYYDHSSKATLKVPINADGDILDDCTAITLDRDGNIWIGSRFKGLIRIRSPFNPSESMNRYMPGTAAGASVPAQITSLFVDLYDTLWCGTEFGLFRYDARSDVFEPVELSNNGENIYISGIVDDARGSFWISSNKGLYWYNPADKSSKFFEMNNSNFSRKGYTFNMVRDESGRVFCSGISGLTFFHPDEVNSFQDERPVMFSDFIIKNRSVIETPGIIEKDINDIASLRLRHKDNSFSFSFCEPKSAARKDMVYSYKLEGYDEDWTMVNSRPRHIQYNNIPSGTYKLLLRGLSTNGEWSENQKTLTIFIRPPFLLTWYMLLLYAVFALSAGYGAYKVYQQRKKGQAMQAANEARMKFYRDIFNDIKTPYSILQAPLQKLKTDYPKLSDAEIGNLLDSAGKGSSLLYMLLEQLSIVCDIDNSTLAVNESEIDFISFAKNVTEAFRTLFESSDISLSFNSDRKSLPLVCDSAKIENVFFSLLSNAYRCTSKNGHVDVNCSVSDDGNVQVSVIDDGPGIPPDVREKLLSVSPSSENPGGTMGLPLARVLVLLHGGDIAIEDNHGGGSIVSFYIPIKEASQTGESLISSHSETLNEYINTLSPSAIPQQYSRPGADLIYVVERDRNLCEMFDKMLRPDYRLECFSSPKGIASKAAEEKPALIISGAIFHNEEQGLDFCKEIKSNPSTDSIPFLFLTGYSNVDFERKAFECGADAYITKPFDMEYLRMRMRQLIQTRKTIQDKIKKDIISNPKELVLTSSDDKFLAHAKDVLEKNIGDESFNITAFASSMNISVSLLHKKMKALTNVTPNDYIKDFRLKRAAQLLKSKAYNITEVADQVGFTDVRYFSTCFKKKFGKTPSSYLRDDMAS